MLRKFGFWMLHKIPNRLKFNLIFKFSLFGVSESKSGPGSSLENTESVRREIVRLVSEREISSIVDIPCGDFNWMSTISKSFSSYLGADIVEGVIANNRIRYPEFAFSVIDAVNDEIPRADLIICRDLLVHLNFKDGLRVIENFRKSGSSFLLVTSFIKHSVNSELRGLWRPLNMELEPFFLTKPLAIIDEKCEEGGGLHRDKSLVLFKMSQ